MSYNHFLRSIRALMPQAVWVSHHDVPLAKLDSETFLVAPLSSWKHVREVNAKHPFPAGVKPLLYADTYSLECVPRGDWLIAGLHGVKKANGNRLGNIVMPIEKFPVVKCADPQCVGCQMNVAYSVPVMKPEKKNL